MRRRTWRNKRKPVRTRPHPKAAEARRTKNYLACVMSPVLYNQYQQRKHTL